MIGTLISIFLKIALLDWHIFSLLRFLKVAETIDIVVENIGGGCTNRFFAIKMIDLKTFCILKNN